MSHRSTASLTSDACTTLPVPPATPRTTTPALPVSPPYGTCPLPPYWHRYHSASPREKPCPNTVSSVPPPTGPVIGTMCDTRTSS